MRPVVDHLVARAEGLEESGHYAYATKVWREAFVISKEPLLLLRLGMAAKRAQDLETAEEAFREAAALDSESPGPHFGLGQLYYGLERFEKAVESLNKALTIVDQKGGWVMLGMSQWHVGNAELARQAFDRALQIDPSLEEAHFGRGLTYRFENERTALACFQRALELKPKWSAALRELGYTWWRIGDLSQAEACLHQAVSNDVSDAWAHNYLGNLLLFKDEISGAEAELKAALDLQPSNAFFSCSLGDALARKGDTNLAAEYYKRALALDINDPLSNRRYGLLLRDKGFIERARVHLARAAEAHPPDSQAARALSDLDRASK